MLRFFLLSVYINKNQNYYIKLKMPPIIKRQMPFCTEKKRSLCETEMNVTQMYQICSKIQASFARSQMQSAA